MKTRSSLFLSFSLLAFTAGCDGVEWGHPKTESEAWQEAAAKRAEQIRQQNLVYQAQGDAQTLQGYEASAKKLEDDLVKSCQATLGQIPTDGTNGKHVAK